MGPVVQERHRPGSLKQQNKSHKHGRHRSKGALDKINKGRGYLSDSIVDTGHVVSYLICILPIFIYSSACIYILHRMS